MPAMQPYSRTAKESSGVGRRVSKIRTLMPLPAMTAAASRANSSEWWRQSKQTAMPRCAASPPSAKMTSAKAWVAWRMTWMFIWCRPTHMVPRRPAVPNSRGAKKRLSISFSSFAMERSSSFSASLRALLPSHFW